MKIVALDVDGCLNSWAGDRRTKEFWWGSNSKEAPFVGGIRQTYLDNLAWIIKETGAKILLSSSWRFMFSYGNHKEPSHREHMAKGLVDALASVGLEIFDFTQKYEYRDLRGEEIQDWMDLHPEVTHYVILDDDSDMTDHQKANHFVQTSMATGLTAEHARRAIELLNGAPCLKST